MLLWALVFHLSSVCWPFNGKACASLHRPTTERIMWFEKGLERFPFQLHDCLVFSFNWPEQAGFKNIIRILLAVDCFFVLSKLYLNSSDSRNSTFLL